MIRLQQSLRCVSCFISFRKKRPITIQHVNITVTSFILASVYNSEKYILNILKLYLIIPHLSVHEAVQAGKKLWKRIRDFNALEQCSQIHKKG